MQKSPADEHVSTFQIPHSYEPVYAAPIFFASYRHANVEELGALYGKTEISKLKLLPKGLR
jgi:hypothetical protein